MVLGKIIGVEIFFFPYISTFEKNELFNSIIMKKSIFLSFSLMLLVSAGVWSQENAFGGKYVNAFNPDSAIEEIRMNLIQAFSPPNKVRMSIYPTLAGWG